MIQDFIVLFLQAFIILFAIFDPIGNIPIFISLTSKLTDEDRKKVARQSVLTAFAILLVFAYAGLAILDFLRITINDFKIAGGILLLILAIEDIVLERRRHRAAEPEDVAIIPLGTPLLAGPGSITTVMILMKPPFGPIVTLLVIIANTIVAWIILSESYFLARLLGRSGLRVITKLMGLIIVAFAVMFIREGIIGIIGQF
jgi:multiple antibiotic resistance protein